VCRQSWINVSHLHARVVSHVALLFLFWSIEGRAVAPGPQITGPPFLNFSEIKALAGLEPPSETRSRLNALLHTPFVRNRPVPSTPSPALGPELRVVFWNIERGLQWELIRTALTDSAQFRKRIVADSPFLIAAGGRHRRSWSSSSMPTSSF